MIDFYIFAAATFFGYLVGLSGICEDDTSIRHFIIFLVMFVVAAAVFPLSMITMYLGRKMGLLNVKA